MSDDFNEFVDSVIVRAADHQTGARVKLLALSDLASEVRPNTPPTWLGMLEERLRSLQYGSLLRDSQLPGRFYLEINAAGLARASIVRELRRPRTLLERLTSETSQRIINLLNFSVALAAFVVALVALSK